MRVAISSRRGQVSGPVHRRGDALGQVEPCLGTSDACVQRIPVRDGDALKAELVLEETVEELAILASMRVVHTLVRA